MRLSVVVVEEVEEGRTATRMKRQKKKLERKRQFLARGKTNDTRSSITRLSFQHFQGIPKWVLCINRESHVFLCSTINFVDRLSLPVICIYPVQCSYIPLLIFILMCDSHSNSSHSFCLKDFCLHNIRRNGNVQGDRIYEGIKSLEASSNIGIP